MWLRAPRSVHSFTFTHPAPASLESFSTLTIAPNGSGPGYLRVAASAGPVTLGTDLALLSPRVEVEGAGRSQIEGNITSLHLTKEGSGTLILAGTLDPAMTLNVNAGTVYLIHSQRLAGLNIAAGATLRRRRLE